MKILNSKGLGRDPQPAVAIPRSQRVNPNESIILSLEAISIPPKNGQPPQRSLVVLHGWGSNAEDLALVSGAIASQDCLMLFPNAPFAHPQVPGGRAWYDLQTLNEAQLVESRGLLQDWMRSLAVQTGVPLEKTVMSGFSQGGAMTLDVGLGLPVAGLCCLSGYLHPQLDEQQQYPPVLLVHGNSDPIVPLSSARQTRQSLTAAGVEVEYYELDMGHEVPPRVVALVQQFLTAKTS